MGFGHSLAFAAGLLCASFVASAQTPVPPDSMPAPEPAASPAVATAPADAGQACCVIADGTPIELEIVDVINTMTIKRGDRFRIRLHAPVTVNGAVVIPAGAEGMGEVVHAEPGRASGKAAELILAARTLDAHGRQVKLRGMKYSQSGANRSGMVAGVSIGIGAFAAFIHGGNIEIPTGTVVAAKIGETVQLPALAASPSPSLEQTETPGTSGADNDVHPTETTLAPSSGDP